MGMHKSGRNNTENPGASVKNDSSVRNDIGKRGGKDLYLRDYITRKQESESFYEPCKVYAKKKLTFEEWLHQSSFVEPDAGTKIWLKECWKVAQENV